MSPGDAEALPTPDASSPAEDASEALDAAGVAADAAPEPPDAQLAGLDAAQPLVGCEQGAFTARFGNLHAHTSYSDGEQTPADAFDYARNVAKLDVMLVTDHLEQVSIPMRWWNCRDQADDRDVPGQYVAACGYEYATFDPLPISTGHNNVFFNASLMNATKTNFHDLYAGLASCAECVGQFNHPGDEERQTWSDWEFDAAADEKIALFEFNGGGAVWDLYFVALDKGWHVSPANNQDNHSANWGTANSHRSGLFMADLTRDGLKEAMRARRTFSTEDANASIRLMGQGVCWMGSRLANVGGTLSAHVHAEDPDAAESWTSIELFGPGKTALGTQLCAPGATCSADFQVPLTGGTYLVARATQADGEVLVSAPIWAMP
ncbi:MAG: hypothetical protein QM765_13130 [Myxococcales bacterium]